MPFPPCLSVQPLLILQNPGSALPALESAHSMPCPSSPLCHATLFPWLLLQLFILQIFIEHGPAPGSVQGAEDTRPRLSSVRPVHGSASPCEPLPGGADSKGNNEGSPQGDGTSAGELKRWGRGESDANSTFQATSKNWGKLPTSPTPEVKILGKPLPDEYKACSVPLCQGAALAAGCPRKLRPRGGKA